MQYQSIPYRTTSATSLSAWNPAITDVRPRLSVPLVDALPPLGTDHEVWSQAKAIGPFHRPLETQRLLAPVHGLDVASVAQSPTLLARSEQAHATEVQLIAWNQSPRNSILRLRFECYDPDMARLKDHDKNANPLTRDYVSMLVNADRAHDRVNEIGVTCDGVIFMRPYHQYVGAHACESGLHAGQANVLGDVQPTDGRPEDAVPEDSSREQFTQVQARVWLQDDRWYAELQIPLNRFGQYGDLYMVYPCNFYRHHPVRPVGAPAGIDWRAGIAGFIWSPVRFLVEEFDKAGFVGIGDIDDHTFEQQVKRIEDAVGRAHEQRKIELVTRKADAADAWRKQLDPKTLDTQWRPRALPDYEWIERGFSLNNSRQLITLDDGRTLVLAEDVEKLCLFTSPQQIDPVSHDLSDNAVILVGENAAISGAEGEISHASMLLQGETIHLVFAAGDAAWWATASVHATDKWDSRRINAPAGARPYDLECVGSSVAVVLADSRQRLWLARMDSEAQPLPFPGRCPVLAASAQGVHLAYEFNATIYYVKLNNELAPLGDPVIAVYAEVLHPAMVEYNGQPLIVYQYLGVQKCDPDPRLYIAERERSGAGIGFAQLTEDNRWRHDHVEAYEEVVVRKLDSSQYMLDMINRPHRGRAFPMMDENWRPAISIDANNIVRAAWQNTTRCHAFVAQFNGESFARREELAGPLSMPTAHLTLEKHPPTQSPLNHLMVAERRLLLDTQPTRGVNLDRSDAIYFLDEAAIQSRRGLKRRINPFRRITTDPILTLTGSGVGEGRDGLSRPTVWRGEDDIFCMLCADHAHGDRHLYALSNDGLDWRFVDKAEFFAHVTGDMSKILEQTGDEKFLAPGYTFTRAFNGLEDLLETDPAKRFKKLTVEGGAIDTYATRRVWYSPDGWNWTQGPEAVNNIHLNETHIPNLYDPWDVPERRFKIYGRTTTEQGRTLAMLWSGDMIHWHGDHEPVVREDPYSRPAAQRAAPVREAFITLEGSASTSESEHYYCTPWLEAGHYMLLHANLHADGHKSVRIAFSRDGFHFKRLGDQEIFDVGIPGTFDSGSIDHPCDVEVGDETWLYYSGTGEKHGTLPYTGQHAFGVAKVRRNSWSYYELDRDVTEGELVTIPIPAGRNLTVNKQGDVRVEVLSIEGFSLGDLDPIADGLESPVTWQGKPLSAYRADSLQLRFTLHGADARLYSFALPQA